MSNNPEHAPRPDSVQPDGFLPLAEELSAAVAQRLGAQAESLAPTAIDIIVDEALHQAAAGLILAKLTDLEPAAFAELYERVHGSGELLERLQQLRTAKQAALERQLAVEALERDASISGRLQLGRLAAGEVITVGLFDQRQPALAARRYASDSQHKPLYRTMRWRLLEPDTGYGETLSDTWQAPRWASDSQPELITPHSRGWIGSSKFAAGETQIAAEISTHSTISYQLDGDPAPTTPPQIVGYIETEDGRLLLDGYRT